MNLNPWIDVPQNSDACRAFNRARARFPWLRIVHRGVGTHTGRGTSWSGAYDQYELIDPLSPDFGMTGRVSEAAQEIEMEIVYAIGANRANGTF